MRLVKSSNDLRTYRDARGFTQIDAAGAHEVSLSLWEKMEGGRRNIPKWLRREIGDIARWEKKRFRGIAKKVAAGG